MSMLPEGNSFLTGKIIFQFAKCEITRASWDSFGGSIPAGAPFGGGSIGLAIQQTNSGWFYLLKMGGSFHGKL